MIIKYHHAYEKSKTTKITDSSRDEHFRMSRERGLCATTHALNKYSRIFSSWHLNKFEISENVENLKITMLNKHRFIIFSEILKWIFGRRKKAEIPRISI